jgi:hypothetical protein
MVLDVAACRYFGLLGLNRYLLGVVQMEDHFILKMSVGLT